VHHVVHHFRKLVVHATAAAQQHVMGGPLCCSRHGTQGTLGGQPGHTPQVLMWQIECPMGALMLLRCDARGAQPGHHTLQAHTWSGCWPVGLSVLVLPCKGSAA
jgi:hypothetical protein